MKRKIYNNYNRHASKKFGTILRKWRKDREFTQDKAARKLGYNAEIEQHYKYSRTWWDDPGRVIIDAKGKKKSKVLLEVAKEMRKTQTKT